MVPVWIFGVVVALCGTGVGAVWNPGARSLHLFFDMEGLATTTNVYLKQHNPIKPEGGARVITATEPWETIIFAYDSVVQISPTEVRLYYDTFGPAGRWLCVAVSHDGGVSFTKPTLGLIPFNGSTANNIIAGPNIEPGTVFLDRNPEAVPEERFKMVISWNGGATMFGSADGFNFTNLTATPLLKGSDTQDVVFWDAAVGGYVYYGRSHVKGGQTISCSTYLNMPGTQEPGRSINRFVIGSNVTDWPYHSADANQTDLLVFNTDTSDPPCIDLYTSGTSPLADGYLLFPMMFNHFDEGYSQGRGNDGLLEARMAVSRNGHNVSYVDRAAWLPRGDGEPRVNHTGIYEGAFDSASTAVVRGVVQTDQETIMYGWGSQYTHGGYVGFTTPPCRVNPTVPCSVDSGIQRLRLRKNGFVSLSTTPNNGGTPGTLTTEPFVLPSCGGVEVLQLNIFTTIGRGATVRLINPTSGGEIARSVVIEGGSIRYNVSWEVQAAGQREWVDTGCAYEQPEPADSCGAGQAHQNCTTHHDCCVHDGRDWGVTGTCHGVHVDCIKGICQTGAPGGESCGHWAEVGTWKNLGSDMRALNLGEQPVTLTLSMGAGDLYSMQTLCATTD